MEPERSIVVVGAGAVGGYLGAWLSTVPGVRVTLVARARIAAAIRSHGLVIREAGAETIYSPHVVESTIGLAAPGLILLTVRTYDVSRLAQEVQDLAGDVSLLLPFQNGVGTDEALAQIIGKDRILPSTLTVSVGMNEPGVIDRYSQGGGIALASMNGSRIPAWVASIFAATNLPTMCIDDYRALRWSKLLLNMLAAPSSAILDMDIRPLMSDSRIFRIEQLAFLEGMRVMTVLGVKAVNLPGYRVRMASRMMHLPSLLAHRVLAPRIIAAREGHSPGMRWDTERGRTEVAALNGAIVAAGGKVGVRTPVNEALTELTEDLALNAGKRKTFRNRPEALVHEIRARGVRV